MNKSRLDIISKLTNSIDISNINFSLIKENSIFLYKLFKDIKLHWTDETRVHVKLNDILYKKIMGIVNNSLIVENPYVKNELNKLNKIIQISDSNIDFYYLDLGNYDSDIELINKLFNQSVCLAKYCELYEKSNIIIIWIPIDKLRDYSFDTINEENLKLSISNFNAFTASGVTFGDIPRITIISRYEEISKLLIHELVHNFNLDGSKFHNHNHSLITKYKTIKNPPTSFPVVNYDYSYSIYESYTELLSSYISMIFRNINLKKKIKLIKRFETEILIELIYSYNIIANLIKINDYISYDDFELEKKFKGEICVYEYYYLKGLMYNNYELIMCSNKEDFKNNYLKIISINKNDPLLKDIFNNMVKQTNFKYIFYD
jgi:hypothetical protein